MHIRILLPLLLAFALMQEAQAQIGEATIGNPAIGRVTVGAFSTTGKSDLPVCGPKEASCTPAPYLFTGNGFWDLAENWLNNEVPPLTLPAGETVVIAPVEGGECILNVAQTVAAAAALTVLPGKRLRVLKSLVFLQ